MGPWSGSRGAHLAQADGVVEGLGTRVEVHGLPHLVLALVLPGQVVGGRPVPSLAGYLGGLETPGTVAARPARPAAAGPLPWSTQPPPSALPPRVPRPDPTRSGHPPAGCCPGSSGCGPGRSSPGPARSSAAPRPSWPGSPGTGPTTATASCGATPLLRPLPRPTAAGRWDAGRPSLGEVPGRPGVQPGGAGTLHAVAQKAPAGGPAGWHSLVLHLVDVQPQSLQVLHQHPRHLEAVRVRLLVAAGAETASLTPAQVQP